MNLSYTMHIGENKVNLTFTPSLEQRTLANIAITLWNQDDVRDLMSKSILHILHKNWQDIEKAVIEKSFKLQLPRKLNEKLLCFIGRVGLQILSWVDVHHCRYNLVTELPVTFVWTSLGTINNIKTAKLLMIGGTLDNEKSFALASIYCLENEIKYYWNNLYFSGHKFKFGVTDCVSYWTVHMYELLKEEVLITYVPNLVPHPNLILDATEHGNEVATRHFFNMNNNIKNYDLIKYSAKVVALKLCNLKKVTSLQQYSDVMLFLLSIMNVEQQANMIVNYTYAFLKCLLVWPWHSLLLEMSKDMWPSLSKMEYSDLLCSMVDFMCYEHNLHKLFGEFWQQSPEAYKQYFIDQGNIVYLLIGLYKREDEKNVKLILKGSSISTKINFKIMIRIRPVFTYLVSSEKWDSIEFLMQECLSSRDDFIKFKVAFKCMPQFFSENAICKGGYSEELFIEEYQWAKFFQLVDGYISRYNNKKRCIEGNSSSKKH